MYLGLPALYCVLLWNLTILLAQQSLENTVILTVLDPKNGKKVVYGNRHIHNRRAKPFHFNTEWK
jgi:hypothetical protein